MAWHEIMKLPTITSVLDIIGSPDLTFFRGFNKLHAINGVGHRFAQVAGGRYGRWQVAGMAHVQRGSCSAWLMFSVAGCRYGRLQVAGMQVVPLLPF